MRKPVAFLFLLAGLVLAFAGCKKALPALDVEKPAASFNKKRCGSIRGRVIWEGDNPIAAPFKVRSHDHFVRKHLVGKSFDNPNLPVIDAESGGVEDAVIYLCGIDKQKAAPWDHPPVSVEQRDFQFLVHQGYERGRIGFVRRGDEVKFRSTTSKTHMLRARGDAFFSLPFVEPNRDTVRRLDRTGLVDLSSGVGYYWMQAYLFVNEHPYITRTDKYGQFHLQDVPKGDCFIVCWMPNWRIEGHDRETEAGFVKHVTFAKPMEQESRITMKAGRESTVEFRVYREMFEH